MSFTSRERLEKKTAPWDLDRLHYLQALVTEFQDTHKKDHKLQILANLGNFAYDPVNYEFFRQLNILDLFIDVLAEEDDEKMVEFAIGGVCNCCLDKLNKAHLIDNEGVEMAAKCLTSSNEETVLSAITTLMFLTTPETRKATTAENVTVLMKKFAESSSKRLANLAVVFLEDYCELSADSSFTARAPKRRRT